MQRVIPAASFYSLLIAALAVSAIGLRGYVISGDELLASGLLVASLGVTLASTLRASTQLHSGIAPTALIPTGVGLISTGMAVSAMVTSEHPETSKLYRLQVAGVMPGDTTEALWVSLFGLIGALVAISLPTLTKRPEAIVANSPGRVVTRQIYDALLVLAAVGFVLGAGRPEADFANRGAQSGVGALSILYWAGAASIALGILHRHWDSKWRLFGTLIVFLMIITSGNRLPILLISCAAAVRGMRDLSQSRLLAYVTASPLVALFMIVVSAWRGSRIDGAPVSYLGALKLVMADPLTAFTRGGFDTFAGLQLSLNIPIRAEWWTPLMAFGNFIPRQLWAGKPQIFGSEVTHDYIGLPHGGIFLSGLGYLYLLTGSVIGAIALYSLTIRVTLQLTVRLGADPFFATLALFFVITFAMGGDPFNAFLVLQVAGTYFLLSLVAKRRANRFLRLPKEKGETHTGPDGRPIAEPKALAVFIR